MSLDAYPGDAVIRRKLAKQEAARSKVNGVELGPDSPLLPAPRASGRRKTGGPLSSDLEHQLQSEVFDRVNADDEIIRRPGLALVFAVPNGGKRTLGVAKKLKAEGVKPGVPDIVCAVARGGYFGLWIEMKVPGGTTTPAQAHWLHQLAIEGHKVALHTTAMGAWSELCNYLDTARTVIKT